MPPAEVEEERTLVRMSQNIYVVNNFIFNLGQILL
jgi:hypothetical protein